MEKDDTQPAEHYNHLSWKPCSRMLSATMYQRCRVLPLNLSNIARKSPLLRRALLQSRFWAWFTNFLSPEEKNGLLSVNTWCENEIQANSDAIAASSAGRTIHFGALMIIMSIKGFERNPECWKLKCRIVFRGDAVVDQAFHSAVFEIFSASGPSSLAGLNSVIAYSLLKGNKCSTSDAVKAFVQAELTGKTATYVLLPPELVPAHNRHIRQPCVLLRKALYGHAPSSFEWSNHLSACLRAMRGHEFANLPSCFHFPSAALCLSIYVDDFTLGGPEECHDPKE